MGFNTFDHQLPQGSDIKSTGTGFAAGFLRARNGKVPAVLEAGPVDLDEVGERVLQDIEKILGPLPLYLHMELTITEFEEGVTVIRVVQEHAFFPMELVNLTVGAEMFMGIGMGTYDHPGDESGGDSCITQTMAIRGISGGSVSSPLHGRSGRTWGTSCATRLERLSIRRVSPDSGRR